MSRTSSRAEGGPQRELEPLLLDVKAAARMLSLSPRSVQRLVQRGQLRAVRPLGCGRGKPLLIAADDLRLFVERLRQGPLEKKAAGGAAPPAGVTMRDER